MNECGEIMLMHLTFVFNNLTELHIGAQMTEFSALI